MANLRCPNCGIKHNHGTHCAFCGEELEIDFETMPPQEARSAISPQEGPPAPSPQNEEAAPSSQFAEPSSKTDEIVHSDTTSEKAYHVPELPQSGVLIQDKHPFRLFLIVLISCLALAYLFFTLNPPQDQSPIAQQDLTIVPPTPVPEPKPVTQKVKETESKHEIDNNQYVNRYLPEITEEMILNRLRYNISVLLTEKDLNKKEEALRQQIDEALISNKMHSNSEDFIIAMNCDIKQCQRILKRANYKYLYKLISDKHKNAYTNSFNYNILTDWKEDLSVYLYSNDSLPANTSVTDRTTCSNNIFDYNDDILNVSIEFTVHRDKQLEISLGWNDFGKRYKRFYPGFVVDPNILIDDGTQERFIRVEETRSDGGLIISRLMKKLSPTARALLKAPGLGIVYGRFIPDPKYNRVYFVLSFREYSMNYNLSCPVLRRYKNKIFPPPPPSPGTRPRDSQIDLPF